MKITVAEKKISKNVLLLYVLVFSKIVFPLITFPYFTRVLSVEIYGVISYVSACMRIMQMIIDFGFLLSAVKDIALVKNNKERIGYITGHVLVGKCILAVGAFFITILMCIYIPSLSRHVCFSILSFFAIVLTIPMVDFLFRGLEKMEMLSYVFFIMKGISTVLTFVVVHTDNDILWIPILDIISSLIAIIFVLYTIRLFKIPIVFHSIYYTVQLLKESFTYFISNMATTAFGALNTLLVGIYISDTRDIAYWSVAITIIGGIQMLYAPIISGIYPHMVQYPSTLIIKRIIRIFMPIIFIGSGILYVFSELIIVLISGNNYVASFPILRLLIPVLIFSFPVMLLGWPTLGAINLAKKVTTTTIVTAVFQILGLGFLIFFDVFTLVTIAILRCFTELLLLFLRGYYCYKYRREFK